ncbi:MAG: cytochrome P450 [Chloroflexi bacterium]|nr:MAG: cytochrome P450 [Chloroflexota bacterium]
MSNMDIEMQKVSREILINELGSSTEERVAWFHHMQKTQPIRYRPEYNLWEVYRYKDAQQVLSDWATFSIEKNFPEDLPFLLGKSDPPRHRQLRSLVSKAFAPRRIEGLTPHFIQIVDGLLEPAKVLGKMDVIAEFAYPLPVRVMAEMLGLPLSDQERFLQWSYQLLGQMIGVSDPDNSELVHYFSELLNERKSQPRDDFISALLEAEENGAHLTHEEILNLCMEMMMVGNVTTTWLLSWIIHRLCLHPEIYQDLRADPSLIPGAVEETLRYDFSSFDLWRSARHDTVLDGQEIKAGQYVLARISAANFDETYFPHSEQFDIRRSPNPHLTFGHGGHSCLGVLVARSEVRTALERIVAHFSEIRPDPEKPVQYTDHSRTAGFIQSLSVLFTPS